MTAFKRESNSPLICHIRILICVTKVSHVSFLVASCHKVHNFTVQSILQQKFYTKKVKQGISRAMGILLLASWSDAKTKPHGQGQPISH